VETRFGFHFILPLKPFGATSAKPSGKSTKRSLLELEKTKATSYLKKKKEKYYI